jgi:hypothetical protein
LQELSSKEKVTLNVEGIETYYEGEEGFIKPERELGVFEIDYGEDGKPVFEKANLERLEIGTLVISKLRRDTHLNFKTRDEKYAKTSSSIKQLG